MKTMGERKENLSPEDITVRKCCEGEFCRRFLWPLYRG